MLSQALEKLKLDAILKPPQMTRKGHGNGVKAREGEMCQRCQLPKHRKFFRIPLLECFKSKRPLDSLIWWSTYQI